MNSLFQILEIKWGISSVCSKSHFAVAEQSMNPDIFTLLHINHLHRLFYIHEFLKPCCFLRRGMLFIFWSVELWFCNINTVDVRWRRGHLEMAFVLVQYKTTFEKYFHLFKTEKWTLARAVSPQVWTPSRHGCCSSWWFQAICCFFLPLICSKEATLPSRQRLSAATWVLLCFRWALVL